MNYSSKTLKTVNNVTGETSTSTVIGEQNNGQTKGLTMGQVNVRAYDFLQDMFNYRKSSMLVLNHVRDNLDVNNLFMIDNATATAKVIGVSRNVFYDTLKKLVEVGLMFSIGSKTYDVNPFIFMSTKVKKREDRVFLQKLWSQQFGDITDRSKWAVDGLSNIIVDQEQYFTYLKSERWLEKKEECKRLAGNKCQRCGSEHSLEAHHVSYESLYNESQDHLECLCHLCHTIIHKQKG